jgi:hypothetical protein
MPLAMFEIKELDVGHLFFDDLIAIINKINKTRRSIYVRAG